MLTTPRRCPLDIPECLNASEPPCCTTLGVDVTAGQKVIRYHCLHCGPVHAMGGDEPQATSAPLQRRTRSRNALQAKAQQRNSHLALIKARLEDAHCPGCNSKPFPVAPQRLLRYREALLTCISCSRRWQVAVPDPPAPE